MTLRRIIALSTLVLLSILAVPSTSAVQEKITMDVSCEGSGTEEDCFALSWSYPDRVGSDKRYLVSITTWYADTDVDQVEFDFSSPANGCVVVSESVGAFRDNSHVWRATIDMNGTSSCSLSVRVQGRDLLNNVIYEAHATMSTASVPETLSTAKTPSESFRFESVDNFTLLALLLALAAVTFFTRGWLPSGFALTSAALVAFVAGLGLQAAVDVFLFFLGAAIIVALIEAIRFGLVSPRNDQG